MSVVEFKQSGNFKDTRNFLKSANDSRIIDSINRIAAMGVRSLMAATPVRTGQTASSWDYTIERSNGRTIVSFVNSNVNRGVNIAIILQEGHATRNGGYVQGRDYINPALRPIFDSMEKSMWEAVIGK